MKKITLLTTIIILLFTLVSCKTNFSKYANTYVMSSYEVDETDVKYDFEVIEKYEIELLDNGYAKHTLKVGVNDEVAEFSNHYDVDLKKNKIHFYIKQGLVVLYKESWDFIDGQIIMKNLMVPIVKEPDETNTSHYVNVTIYFDVI